MGNIAVERITARPNSQVGGLSHNHNRSWEAAERQE